ncbi:NADP-dependent oxidoreductase [Micromonospora sp. NPDC003197]
MRTAQITGYGGPEVLEVNEIPAPQAGPDQALVAVVASTINPVDVKTRTPGTVQQVDRFPATLGWDIAGIVLDAPAGTDWRPGDHVIALNPPSAGRGSWAEIVAIPASLLVAAPQSVDLATSATLPLAGLTAQQALHRLSPRVGERILVIGAAGGVGGIAVQLLAADGIEVSGLVSRPEHVDVTRALGATNVSADPGTLGEFDAIFDTAGVFDARLLHTGGRLVTVSDEEIPTALTEKASGAEHNYVRHDPAGLRALVELVDTGALTLRVAEQHPLTRIRRAHERFEKSGLTGKIVITM